ncbi:MAG: ABC transporter substrate-binding protein [Clostridia bacterium]|nr:ABC transporter substrate-binding protein [Clostridia bacterium]
MKKSLTILAALCLVLALFAGCGTVETEPSPSASPEVGENTDLGSVKLATLKGATTMGLVKLLDDSAADSLNYSVDNTVYGTADEINTLLINGDVDMAALPCNVASILYNKTEGDVQIAAINTLGVLSIIEVGDSIKSVADLKGKTIYSTGKGTTPEYVLNAILTANGIDPEKDVTIEYKSESTEIAAYLTGETAVDGAVAVLPQPYATTVLMTNENARIALDLTAEWENAGLDGKLVTGVLVVRKEFAETNADLMSAFLADYADSVSWVNANADAAAELIVAAGIVAKAPIAVNALPYCNIVFESGNDMVTDVSAYLGVLYEQNPASIGGTLPDESIFYTE